MTVESDAGANLQNTAAKKPSIRTKFARWLFIISVATLTFGYLAIAIVWLYAMQTGRIPDDSDLARYDRTGHGPWDHVGDLNLILGRGMDALFLAAFFAIVSMTLHPHRLTVLLTAICIVSGVTVISTHFWLID